jgi:hypothetical protein
MFPAAFVPEVFGLYNLGISCQNPSDIRFFPLALNVLDANLSFYGP